MNLRDVPDDVYAALAAAAEVNRQSQSAFVVERLAEVAQVTRLDDYVASYQPPERSGMTVEDAVAAVREVRQTYAATPLLQRIWELRENVTAYAAAYVALAERLVGQLISCDSKLAGASGPRCRWDFL